MTLDHVIAAAESVGLAALFEWLGWVAPDGRNVACAYLYRRERGEWVEQFCATVYADSEAEAVRRVARAASAYVNAVGVR